MPIGTRPAGGLRRARPLVLLKRVINPRLVTAARSRLPAPQQVRDVNRLPVEPGPAGDFAGISRAFRVAMGGPIRAWLWHGVDRPFSAELTEADIVLSTDTTLVTSARGMALLRSVGGSRAR